MFSKKRHPIICLLEIPVEFVGYVILIGLGAQLDTLLFGTGDADIVGHPFPVFFMIVLVIATVLFLVTVGFSVINFFRYSIQKRNGKKKANDLKGGA